QKKERISAVEFKELWEAYLKSPYWLARKSMVFARAKGRCENCEKAPAVDCHHLHYAHRFKEPLEDLLAVCRTCHNFFSKRGADPEESISLQTMNQKLDELIEQFGKKFGETNYQDLNVVEKLSPAMTVPRELSKPIHRVHAPKQDLWNWYAK